VERRPRQALARGHREGRDRVGRPGVHLATEKEYGNFELYVDWLMVSPNGDSGHLPAQLPAGPDLGSRQPARDRERRGQRLRSPLEQQRRQPGQVPLVKADNPIGQWNTLRVRMVGNRVSIWLNGRQTVNEQVLDNFFDRKQQVLPKGQIELQTHDRRSASATSSSGRSGRVGGFVHARRLAAHRIRHPARVRQREREALLHRQPAGSQVDLIRPPFWLTHASWRLRWHAAASAAVRSASAAQ